MFNEAVLSMYVNDKLVQYRSESNSQKDLQLIVEGLKLLTVHQFLSTLNSKLKNLSLALQGKLKA